MTLADPSAFIPTPVFRARRRRALLRVRLEDGAGQLCEAMVQDISATGLRAVARLAAPAEGEVLTLHLPDGRALWGLVRWVNGKQFGVEFDTATCAEPGLAAKGLVPVRN